MNQVVDRNLGKDSPGFNKIFWKIYRWSFTKTLTNRAIRFMICHPTLKFSWEITKSLVMQFMTLKNWLTMSISWWWFTYLWYSSQVKGNKPRINKKLSLFFLNIPIWNISAYNLLWSFAVTLHSIDVLSFETVQNMFSSLILCIGHPLLRFACGPVS